MTPAERIALELTSDEALVLFAWLSRFNEREDVVFEDQAEQRVLWDIECLLERELVEPFLPDYGARLAGARDRVRDSLE